VTFNGHILLYAKGQAFTELFSESYETLEIVGAFTIENIIFGVPIQRELVKC
jgi:hypothetical protein